MSETHTPAPVAAPVAAPPTEAPPSPIPGDPTPATPLDHARRALTLLTEPGQVVELRAVHVGKYRQTHSGYYDADHLDKLAADAVELSRTAGAVYVTPNPVNPALLGRRYNRVDQCGKDEPTTNDKDVTCRRWLMIDCDPPRPAGVSSTNAEHTAAIERAYDLRDYLIGLGWPPESMFLDDSGNGAHVFARIDLPNDADALTLITRFLAALTWFDDDRVKIDTTLCNAARIIKLPGTWVRKGDSTPDRPHRRACILEYPAGEMAVISRGQIQDVIDQLYIPEPTPEPPRRGTSYTGTPGAPIDVADFIRAAGLHVRKEGPWGNGYKWLLSECPFDPSHTDKSAVLLQFASGAVAFRCQHNSCTGRDWHALRAKYNYRPASRAALAAPNTAPYTAPAPASNGNGHTPPADDGPRSRLLDRAAVAALPPPAWRVKGLLEASSVALLYGPTGIGKTFLTLDLALAVATGRPWWGKPVKPGLVLYILAEGASGLNARLLAWEQTRGGAAAHNIYFLTDAINLMDGGTAPDLAAMLPEPPALIVIDTLARSIDGGDENDNSGMSRAMQTATNLMQSTGATVLIVHHCGKSDNGPRGASAIPAACDTILKMTEDGGTLTLQSEKQRNADSSTLWRFALDVVTIGSRPDDPQEAWTSCVLRLASDEDARRPAQLRPRERQILEKLNSPVLQHATAGELEKATDMPGSSLFKALTGLEKRGLIGVDGPPKTPGRRYWITDTGRDSLSLDSTPDSTTPHLKGVWSGESPQGHHSIDSNGADIESESHTPRGSDPGPYPGHGCECGRNDYKLRGVPPRWVCPCGRPAVSTGGAV